MLRSQFEENEPLDDMAVVWGMQCAKRTLRRNFSPPSFQVAILCDEKFIRKEAGPIFTPVANRGPDSW